MVDRRPFRWLFGLTCVALASACGSTLPDDVRGYESDCIRMNAAPIPPYQGDPHRGRKNVYACEVAQEQLEANARPFPDGALIVKESTRDGESHVWLIATARKQGDSWQWDEYTRNFADEEFRHILSGESVCTGCHDDARAADWIFTTYDAAPDGATCSPSQREQCGQRGDQEVLELGPR